MRWKRLIDGSRQAAADADRAWTVLAEASSAVAAVGLSQAQYCRQHQPPPGTFGWWKETVVRCERTRPADRQASDRGPEEFLRGTDARANGRLPPPRARSSTRSSCPRGGVYDWALALSPSGCGSCSSCWREHAELASGGAGVRPRAADGHASQFRSSGLHGPRGVAPGSALGSSVRVRQSHGRSDERSCSGTAAVTCCSTSVWNGESSTCRPRRPSAWRSMCRD